MENKFNNPTPKQVGVKKYISSKFKSFKTYD